MSEDLQASDVQGDISITFDGVLCRRCKNKTSLSYSTERPGECLDYCGYCDQAYFYDVRQHRVFSTPRAEII